MTSGSSCRSLSRAALAPAIALAAAACGPTDTGYDSGLAGLSIESVSPGTVLPGSVIDVDGRSFVGAQWGDMALRLSGSLAASGGILEVDARLPMQFVDFDHGQVVVDDNAIAALGAPSGDFTGDAWVSVESVVDGDTHESERIPVDLAVRRELTPEIESLRGEGLVFVNEPIGVEGAGFLLGEGEGQTVAVLDGCFRRAGGDTCAELEPVEVPVEAKAGDRTRGTFAFSPDIAGIEPGVFEGDVALRNDHAGGGGLAVGGSRAVTYELAEPAIFEVEPGEASLGQYVFVRGGGFVGGDGGTIVELAGTFTPSDGEPTPAELLLIPEFVEGGTVRYVLAEDDSLGQVVDLRAETGTFEGDVTPVVSWNGTDVRGDSTPVSLRIAPVKQVVYLRFTRAYVESLRQFGLRGVDAAIRDRAVEVVRRDYDTLNLEVRRSEPEDYALYAQVDIGGPDPNDLGLLGYDNTPGKDVDNERLYDRIGGVNATTQQDGYPGYGGVFVESLFSFSPAAQTSLSDETFDEIFDPFRPDRGGDPVRAADLEGGIPTVSSGADCPAGGGSRRDRIACAVWVLGSLVGTTLSHEIGHSLGLANPYGDGFHNPGDGDSRLMDSGSNRSFVERAELFGNGPARFCAEEYAYLREILPTGEPADTSQRPPCF